MVPSDPPSTPTGSIPEVSNSFLPSTVSKLDGVLNAMCICPPFLRSRPLVDISDHGSHDARLDVHEMSMDSQLEGITTVFSHPTNFNVKVV